MQGPKKGIMAVGICSAWLTACGGGSSAALTSPPAPNPTQSASTPSFVATPLTQISASATYKGFHGGLYENGSNTPPADHASAGTSFAAAVAPRDVNGNLSPSGKFVLLSVGMSNTTNAWCIGPPPHTTPLPPSGCFPYTFMGQTANDASVNHTTMAIANGAAGGQTADVWAQATACLPNYSACNEYDRVRDAVLTPAGLSEKQVEVAWLSEADANPTVSLPASNADAYQLETYLGEDLRAMKMRYPNLLLVFVSSRSYAGYASTTLNPEPYAYESGFAVKWLIQAQVDQMRNGGAVVDAKAGDLNYNTGVAPWIAWAPYTWADGSTPRADGLFWLASDYYTDGTHESQAGIQKLVGLLIPFFKQSQFTSRWFL